MERLVPVTGGIAKDGPEKPGDHKIFALHTFTEGTQNSVISPSMIMTGS